MKNLALVAALAAAAVVAAQPGWAARKSHSTHSAATCAKPSEAEQGIRYITDVMVASSACGNTTYREFALRNRETIIRYQNAMIARMHGKAAFDKWNTSLANQASIRESTIPIAQFCQQAQPLLTQAGALNDSSLRAYAAAQAASAPLPAGCTK